MNVLQGLFVIEGIDGSGKTTLGRSLSAAIPNGSYEMQPSLGPTGQKIRNILSHHISCAPEELLDLFVKDRTEHQELLREQIEVLHKQIVLDRYILSTLAYQGLNFSREYLWERNQDFLVPQTTFFLDTPLEVAFSRKEAYMRSQGIDFDFYEDRDLQRQILINYQETIPFLESKGHVIVCLDGSKDESALLADCLQYMGVKDEME